VLHCHSGGLYFEVAGPAAYRNYLAAQRLGFRGGDGLWGCTSETGTHGRWMLDDVALPLAEQYPDDAWELLLGYDQERLMAIRWCCRSASSKGCRSGRFKLEK